MRTTLDRPASGGAVPGRVLARLSMRITASGMETRMVPAHEVRPVPDGAAPHLAAHIRREGDASVLRLRGALSGSRVPLAESVLHRLEKRGGAGLMLDLREVSAIDAIGAAMLRRSEERMLLAGRPMTLLGSADARTCAVGPGAGDVSGAEPGADDR